jgi:hypothetical protein
LGGGAWRVLGASVIGTSHQRTGLPCQDAHGFRALPGGLVLAAADGAGTAERSHEGARLAVDALLDALAQNLAFSWPAGDAEWRSALAVGYAAARAAVLALAQAEGASSRLFASTLVCAVVSSAGVAAAQLGDGVVAALAEGEWFTVAAPQKGEYANETNFLTQADALERVTILVHDDPVQALAVMTDGLLRLVLDIPRNQPHAPFFNPLIAFANGVTDEDQGSAQLAAFLASDRVSARTDDDKTLVLAVAWPPRPTQ